MKLLTKFFALFIAVVITPELSYGVQKEPIFNKLTTNDGLSHSTVYDITQDNNGFIWIGTREGLNRYDSYDIKTYYATPGDPSSLNSNRITSLLTSHNGTLYVGTSIGLNLYNHQKDILENIRFKNTDIGYVNEIFESSTGILYICAQQGLFILNNEGKLEQLITNLPVIAINEYKKNIFWLATNKEIVLINQFGEVIKKYPFLKKAQHELLSAENNISCIFKDKSGDIWIGTQQNGVYRYVPEEDYFEPIIPKHKDNPIEVNVVRTLAEDNAGNLWIGTESGLFIYNKASKNFSHYTQSFDNSPKTLNDKSIYEIYRSDEGIMWIGTYFGGVNFVKPSEKGFYKLIPDGGKESLSGKAVSQVIEDEQGRLWIATEDGGVNVFDKKNGRFEYHKHKADQNSISCNNAHSLHDDGKGNIWIGTFLGGLNKYNIKDQTFTNYNTSTKDSTSILHNNIFSILKDSRGTLWVGTWNGLNVYNYKKDNFSRFERDDLKAKFIYDIVEDYEGNLWFCTRNAGIFLYDVKADKITHFNKNKPGNAGLSNNKIICAYQDSKNRMWFGSLQGGLILWDNTTKSFSAITKEEGLPNDNVYGILEDDHGNLWISTNQGLAKYNPDTKEMSSFDNSHGISDHQFNFKSYYKDKDGWMYFGTVNGLYYFHPDSLSFNKVAPEVHFTDLKLFNKSIPITEEKAKDNILSSHLNETQEIRVRYDQNFITYDFVAINYFSPGNNNFSYYLEGFEEKWSTPTSKRTATYTNLAPGTYTFHVKASNNDGVLSEEKQVDLIVMPPLWMTTWAKMFYVFLFLLLIFLYRRYLLYRQREKMALQLEKVEKENIQELNQHKLNFFTYISHEFKTPLTLIIASIDKFLNNEGKIENRSEFQLIKRNATRLHFLIDQLMGFRKIESDHATLNLSKGDIMLFLHDTFSAFIPLYNKRNIDYRFETNIEECIVYFDPDKIEKILTNLLSNAVKNTRDKVTMKVDIVAQAQQENDLLLKIKISDNGSGFFEGEAEKVFMPFYQSDLQKNKGAGSGIGLALVHGLTKYLNGYINIESTEQKGTVLHVELPLCTEFTSEEKEIKLINGNKPFMVNPDLFHEETLDEERPLELSEKQGREFELMIVEDNAELLKFLINHFTTTYKVVYARNGLEACEKIKQSTPDVIISDVMMPDMDGIELCRTVKSRIDTSHIPFILLTAKASIQNKLEGLDVGADAYLPKPFNVREMELMVKNMIESRNCLKKYFLKFGNLEDYDRPINNRDQDFLNRLSGIVSENMDNADFNISAFTKEAGVSRTLLHLKLKKLVNLSASEFVRTMRLQKATNLLKEEYSVAEVSYMIGFKDPNYFSRSFKEKYGVTPSDYKSSNEDPPAANEIRMSG